MTDRHGLQKELETFFGVLEDATETFNIWQACQQSHGSNETVDMFNTAYPGLFVWIEHALLANSVNCLCFLNEKRNDTLNFGTLLSRFKESLSDISHGELEAKIAELKPVWVKLAVLRNEIFCSPHKQARHYGLLQQSQHLGRTNRVIHQDCTVHCAAPWSCPVRRHLSLHAEQRRNNDQANSESAF